MQFDTKDRQLDLIAILALSTMLLTVILFLDVTWLRVALGLPFVLFFPGYSLVSALFPRQDSPSSLFKKKVELEHTGMDMLERVALSLGLSIAVVPLIGLLLNLTYSWGDGWGIRLYPVMLSVYIFIVISSVVAVVRRLRLPPDERFNIHVNVEYPKDMSVLDKALAVGIVVMLLASVILLAYIIAVPREGEKFTEFYVLGASGKASDYPVNISAGSWHNITAGVVNHEHKDRDYRLVVLLIPSSESNLTQHMVTVRAWDGHAPVLFSSSDAVIFNITVKDGKKLHLNMTVGIKDAGQYKMQFLLFTSNEPPGDTVDAGNSYRDLHLWVRVN